MGFVVPTVPVPMVSVVPNVSVVSTVSVGHLLCPLCLL